MKKAGRSLLSGKRPDLIQSGERILQYDVGVTVRTGRNDGDRTADQFFERTQISARSRRQFVPLGDARGGFGPTRELQIDRLAFVPAGFIQRRIFGLLAMVFVGDAHLQARHAVKDVEFGDAQAGDTVDGDGAF